MIHIKHGPAGVLFNGTMLSLVIRVAACLALLPALPAAGAERSSGQAEYQHMCARCHGDTGRGDGWFVEHLKKPPRTLTQLARENGGVFPAERVRAVIDGRTTVPIHGPRDMPVWGVFYRAQSSVYEPKYRVTYSDESYVRERIKALTDYISTLQE